MSKLSLVAEVCIVVVTPFVVITSVPYLGTSGKSFPDILHAPLMGLIEFFSIYPAMVLLLIFSAAIFGQAGASVYYSLNRKKLVGNFLEAELLPGGALQITGRFSGKLMNGYLVAAIATPTIRDEIRLFFNSESGQGRLHGNYLDEPYLARWNVPENIPESKCNVSVELHDVYTFKLFRTARFDERKAQWKGSTKIVPVLPKKSVEIKNISLPKTNELRPFDDKRLPLAGWICVSLHNDTAEPYSDCSGIVWTDAGCFPLFDYEQVVKTIISTDGKSQERFSIRTKSDTLVCANIIARTPRAMVRINFGDNSIEKEFEINSHHS